MSDTPNNSVPVSLTFSGEQVNKLIADAVLASAIGAEVEKAAKGLFATYEAKNQWEKIIKESVQSEARAVVRKLAEEMVNKDTVREQIRSYITNDLVAKLTATTLNAMEKNLDRLDRGY